MKPEIREQAAKAAWERDPENELHVVGVTWGEYRDQEIRFGNEEFLYAQSDAAVAAYQAAVLPEVEAALDDLIAAVIYEVGVIALGNPTPMAAKAARAQVLAAVKGEG